MIDSPKLASGVHEFVVTLVEDAARRYPKGELVFSIELDDAENLRVAVAGLHLPDVAASGTSTESFDDGFIVVRRDRATDRICGLQVLRYEMGPASVPELMASIVERQDHFLFDAVTTVMVHWALFAQACHITSEANKLKRQWLEGQSGTGKIQEAAVHEPIWKAA